MEIFEKYQLDFWTLLGLTGQGFFFLRMIIQWWQSEKEKRTVVPLSFWWLGLVGAAILFIYAIARKDIVFILTAIIQSFLYSRNLVIAIRSQS
ncbi:MAG: hypothetical protein HON98_05565 [Chloroflexi bacterium]|jgi:lipid-A-disaccharide synthase-like uncharacterized protein|nr:hypothetical protein [Chloroflexota bacterium]MBT3670138.1 hypothetical protein [Chloroflexota bacterium]MBT4306188.1 hypothetical protein [Chloroflexota bacterium]MBT4534568.1 hypothetical protein [Chloroflexota bacterium]MBT4682812.1 hypothetical protein [Chloroflexota bacterium]